MNSVATHGLGPSADPIANQRQPVIACEPASSCDERALRVDWRGHSLSGVARALQAREVSAKGQ